MRSLEGSIVREKKNANNDTHFLSLQSTDAQITVATNALHQSLFTSSCRLEEVEDSNQLCPDSWGADLLVGDGSGGGVGEEEGGGGEQLTEEDRQLAAALVAVQFVPPNGRHSLMQDFGHIAKVVSEGRVVETSSDLIDNSIRIYQEHVQGSEGLRGSSEMMPSLLPLPPLKRVQDTVWYQVKNNIHFHQTKDIAESLSQLPGEECEIDMNNTAQIVGQSKQQNRKVLPHKKRISRKLKKNVAQQQVEDTIQQAVHIIQESVNNQVLDSSMTSSDIAGATGHVNRAVFICQLCGQYYGEDQLQFYHHLKQHYEPSTNSMVMNPMVAMTQQTPEEININKMNDSIAENSQLPESLVELSLEGSDKQILYATHHKLANYMSVDKSLFVSVDKESMFETDTKALFEQSQKQHTYTSADKSFTCHQCNKTFKRHKLYEVHLRDVHSKIDDIGEFSEPEDLMEGIHVVVEPENDEYLQDDLSSEHSNTVLIQTSIGGHDQYILPHLTIDNGHVNSKQWHIKEILRIEGEKSCDGNLMSEELSGDGVESIGLEGGVVCSFCGTLLENKKEYITHADTCQIHLKEEVLQRMMNGIDVSNSDVLDEETIQDNLVVVDNNEEDNCVQTNDNNEGESNSVSAPAKYECKECNKEFKHKNSYVYHQQSHKGTRPYHCEDCPKSFFSSSALKVHARLHSGVKPYKCQDCGRMFRQWGDLKYHCVSIHSNMKQHQCEYCGKDFARKYSLIIHRRIHTGEKNYKCEFCDKKFRASSYLQNHKRVHTGEKPHVCDKCGKAFRMKGDMRRHSATHTKDKTKSPTIKKEKVQDTKDTLKTNKNKLYNNKQKGDTTPKKELKQEDRECNLSNDAGSSPQNDVITTVQDDSKQVNAFQVDNQIYSWPVFIA